MNDNDKLFLNRIEDLASTSYNQNRYTFSNFLSPEEQGLVDSIRSSFNHLHYEFFGGHECCERQVVRFGSPDELSYEENFHIKTLLIEPLIQKFSDSLSHRDFLGALMNLQLNRNVIGDIIIKDNRAYVFCLEDVADFIMSELTRVKHTSVKISTVEGDIPDLNRELVDFDLLVSSNRFDAIVSAITKLSRSKSNLLFREKKILLNNRTCENNSLTLKPGSTISIRGYGKYIFVEEGAHTRKDRLYLKMKTYV